MWREALLMADRMAKMMVMALMVIALYRTHPKKGGVRSGGLGLR